MFVVQSVDSIPLGECRNHTKPGTSECTRATRKLCGGSQVLGFGQCHCKGSVESVSSTRGIGDFDRDGRDFVFASVIQDEEAVFSPGRNHGATESAAKFASQHRS